MNQCRDKDFCTFCISCVWSQVDRQSHFIQGYRVLYRQMSGLSSPGPWQTQDVKVSSERTVMLSSLKKGIVYEIKVRPYFNEFQGMDSESKTARTTEERKMQYHGESMICSIFTVPVKSLYTHAHSYIRFSVFLPFSTLENNTKGTKTLEHIHGTMRQTKVFILWDTRISI